MQKKVLKNVDGKKQKKMGLAVGQVVSGHQKDDANIVGQRGGVPLGMNQEVGGSENHLESLFDVDVVLGRSHGDSRRSLNAVGGLNPDED